MSLNREQTARAGREIAANLALAGLSPETIAQTLEFSPRRAAETLRVGPAADPVDVWAVRDLLDATIRGAGAEPAPWEVLTDKARVAAAQWFALRTPPTVTEAPAA
ncbi:DUF2316 family protein [Demequina sp. SYSU T00039]|uniref:DUF2316 family protein n=1 Tax=Demequina lignilytica TaxID=3051663 RepID=A0AAW7M7E1_9MICO|nr:MULTISPECIES: DUF2316 family protein [unclassified Demequina]MDN4477330.1 DUF2316 family protein [Demequina sp. SYSU T00039-1]MDN4487503.1 DUF2316 family protein [Demequina sp. SYSU T00039]